MHDLTVLIYRQKIKGLKLKIELSLWWTPYNVGSP